jgi:hypothetical protein
MATIYRKTTKGQQEVETRALKLAPKFRSLLIMVDGKRSDDELRRMLPQTEENGLEALAAAGCIEAIAVTADPRPGLRAAGAASPPASMAPVATPSGSPMTDQTPAPAAPALDFDQLRRQAARALTDLIGPLADVPAMRIENAKTPQQLREAIENATRAIAHARGAPAAATFAQRFTLG